MAFTKQNKNGVIFHTCDAFTKAGGTAHGFASRLGGVSQGDFAELNLSITRPDAPEAVRENYARFCSAVGTDAARLVMTHQVHEDTIREASEADIRSDLMDPVSYRTDGLITDKRNLCLTIYYADCPPVLLYDPVRKAIAAVHSGWRGTAKAIAPKAVRKMTALYGSDPTDILAAIGPAICPACFETHRDVPDAMTEALGEEVTSFFRPLGGGKYAVDLKGIIAWELQNAGLPAENIHTLPLCTGCQPELYWSHRKLGDRRGNQAAMIQLL